MYKKIKRHDRNRRPPRPRKFKKIYKLDVMVIPTQEMIREDFPDVIYRNEAEKISSYY